MLIAALAVTLLGFVLLVVALVVSSVGFAWACIAVCVIGFILLVVDVLRGRRSARAEGDAQDNQPESAGAEEAAGSWDANDDANGDPHFR